MKSQSMAQRAPLSRALVLNCQREVPAAALLASLSQELALCQSKEQECFQTN
jgi:hypothetical protein